MSQSSFDGRELLPARFSTVLNPKLYAVDLVRIANKRPRLMFIAFLVGGIGPRSASSTRPVQG